MRCRCHAGVTACSIGRFTNPRTVYTAVADAVIAIANVADAVKLILN
jgi:hypothetical protein